VITDSHVHFFSQGFYRSLAALDSTRTSDPEDGGISTPARLGWTPPGPDEALADAWVAELDRHAVSRAMLIASVHGDERSVMAAVRRHPARFVGAFMLNPAAPDALTRVDSAFTDAGIRMVCLFPAMHHVAVDDQRTVAVFEAAERHGRAVFVHCGVLSVGVRKKLALPSAFDIRLGDPLAVAAVAVRYPTVPVVIPHFGAGLFREALMAAAMAPNIVFDTSSSNDWVRLLPGLTLREVFARSLDVVGPERLLFGSDSSYFPRGWQRAVFEQQHHVIQELGATSADGAAIFSGNFARLIDPRG